MGGEKSDGRWHTAVRGKRIIYLAEHPAVALLESLANLEGDPALFPDTFKLIKAEVPDNISTEILPQTALSELWGDDIVETQAMGDAWLEDGRSALLAVPSLPSPESLNYLFNPRHRDAAGLTIVWCKRMEYDKRLFHVR